MKIEIKTPPWSLPLFEKKHRYIGIKGGRGGGKSHFVAETRIEDLLLNPNHRGVCIREIQKSLKLSSKQLLEDKIRTLGLSNYFDITQNEIRRIDSDGFIVFQGMQDHTADSVKSLEGFDWVWVEEAQNLSDKSQQLLIPTIRKNDSELWFTWNPKKITDAVDRLFNINKPKNSILITVNYWDNPFCPQVLIDEAEEQRSRDIEIYNHVWGGEYDVKSESQVFRNRWVVEEFDIDYKFGQPNQGMDFGFSRDPTAGVRLYVKDGDLYISHEYGGIGIESNDIPFEFKRNIPEFERYPTFADCSRPETISYLKRNGLPRIEAAKKWAGSIEDGITFIRSFNKIIIHPRCKRVIFEFTNYCYEVDKNTSEITTKVMDSHNHYIDAIRYALHKLISKGRGYDYSVLLGGK